MAGDRWQPWRYLLGEWRGIGGDTPGEAASGACSFHLELNDQAIVRRDQPSYTATGERPALAHEDNRYVYPDSGGSRAVYFDTEGHTIWYRASADGLRAVFKSDADAHGMRFRLRDESQPGGLALAFDVASPGADFGPGITGGLTR